MSNAYWENVPKQVLEAEIAERIKLAEAAEKREFLENRRNGMERALKDASRTGTFGHVERTTLEGIELSKRIPTEYHMNRYARLADIYKEIDRLGEQRARLKIDENYHERSMLINKRIQELEKQL